MSARDKESTDQTKPMAPPPNTTQDQSPNNSLSKPPPDKPSKFLTIPAELRNDIYRLVLFDNTSEPPQPTAPHWTPSAYISTCPHEYTTPTLLQICHQIRRKASAIHYLENKFAMCYCKGDLFEYVMERRGEVVEWEGAKKDGRKEGMKGERKGDRKAERKEERKEEEGACKGKGAGESYPRFDSPYGRYIGKMDLEGSWRALPEREKQRGRASTTHMISRPSYPSMGSMSFIATPPTRLD